MSNAIPGLGGNAHLIYERNAVVAGRTRGLKTREGAVGDCYQCEYDNERVRQAVCPKAHFRDGLRCIFDVIRIGKLMRQLSATNRVLKKVVGYESTISRRNHRPGLTEDKRRGSILGHAHKPVLKPLGT